MNTFNRNFGCEFEFSSVFNKIAKLSEPIIKKLYKHKMKILQQQYLSENNKIWHLKTDASTECELVTPVSTLKDLPRILEIIEYLRKNKVKITKNDALHVHVSAKGIPIKKIIIAWLLIENYMIGCFAKNRRNNPFCPKLNIFEENTTIKSAYSDALGLAVEHHATISLEHYPRRKTVEFRLCQATFDPNLIEGWILFCMYFLDWAKTINIREDINRSVNSLKTANQIIKELNIDNPKVKKIIKKKYH